MYSSPPIKPLVTTYDCTLIIVHCFLQIIKNTRKRKNKLALKKTKFEYVCEFCIEVSVIPNDHMDPLQCIDVCIRFNQLIDYS